MWPSTPGGTRGQLHVRVGAQLPADHQLLPRGRVCDHRAIGHGGGPCTLHNPRYDFNDALIPLGATYWVTLARRWLAVPTP